VNRLDAAEVVASKTSRVGAKHHLIASERHSSHR
jgi:hypothetical protein